MSFFEPLPPPPPEREQQWAPPAWDRPSEGILPAALPVNALLYQNDDVAVAIDRLDVYPNGFSISLVILFNPHKAREISAVVHRGGPHMWPRIGVRFADGTTAGRSPGFGGMQQVAKDDDGIPIEPVLRMMGGGGGGSGWRTSAWVFPLPPSGPFDVFVALEAAGLAEASVTLDGTAVRAAGDAARVVWS